MIKKNNKNTDMSIGTRMTKIIDSLINKKYFITEMVLKQKIRTKHFNMTKQAKWWKKHV